MNGGDLCDGQCLSLGLQTSTAQQGVLAQTPSVYVSTQGTARAQPCDSSTSGYGQVGAVGPDSALVQSFSFLLGERVHMGVKTTDGKFAVVALDLPDRVTYYLAADRQVLPGVSEVCGETPVSGR